MSATAATPACEDNAMTRRVDALVARFAEIGEAQMKDLPIYNHALTVEAVGFRYVGALVTPWFINLIALPRAYRPEAEDDDSQYTVMLPCGPTTFLRAVDDAVGVYYSRAALSALFHISNQDEARDEALEELAKVMSPMTALKHIGKASATRVSRRDFFRGRVK